jgi:hypothetical protein
MFAVPGRFAIAGLYQIDTRLLAVARHLGPLKMELMSLVAPLPSGILGEDRTRGGST